ncbi:MAG: hypothetical protein QM820_61950 [Minicystis sp.]
MLDRPASRSGPSDITPDTGSAGAPGRRYANPEGADPPASGMACVQPASISARASVSTPARALHAYTSCPVGRSPSADRSVASAPFSIGCCAAPACPTIASGVCRTDTNGAASSPPNGQRPMATRPSSASAIVDIPGTGAASTRRSLANPGSIVPSASALRLLAGPPAKAATSRSGATPSGGRPVPCKPIRDRGSSTPGTSRRSTCRVSSATSRTIASGAFGSGRIAVSYANAGAPFTSPRPLAARAVHTPSPARAGWITAAIAAGGNPSAAGAAAPPGSMVASTRFAGDIFAATPSIEPATARTARADPSPSSSPAARAITSPTAGARCGIRCTLAPSVFCAPVLSDPSRRSTAAGSASLPSAITSRSPCSSCRASAGGEPNVISVRPTPRVLPVASQLSIAAAARCQRDPASRASPSPFRSSSVIPCTAPNAFVT